MIERETLIQRIYEASAFPEEWPAVLEEFGRLAETPGMVLLTRRSDAWSGFAVSKPLEHDFLQYLNTDIVDRSQTTPRLLGKDWEGFLSDDDLFSVEEWEKEPFRNEWGRRWGWNHAAATAVQVPTGDFLVFHAQRRHDQPSFSARNIALLNSFRPHLARAGLLAARWRLQRLRAAAEALGLIGVPAAILDRTGRSLAANALIQSQASHLRWLPRDAVGLVDPTAHAMFKAALASLFQPGASSILSFASRVAPSDAAVVHLIPIAGKARDLFDGGLTILTVTPLGTPDAPPTALIRALFDLTPSESRLARELTTGKTLEQMAAAFGVSRETVRTQMRAVFAKTGTNRQAEVAALLAGLPKFPI